MTIQEFWNQAFIAALHHLPAASARVQADEATRICIEQWQDQRQTWAPQYLTRWQDQKIDAVPMKLDELELSDQGTIVRKRAPAEDRSASRQPRHPEPPRSPRPAARSPAKRLRETSPR